MLTSDFIFLRYSKYRISCVFFTDAPSYVHIHRINDDVVVTLMQYLQSTNALLRSSWCPACLHSARSDIRKTTLIILLGTFGDLLSSLKIVLSWLLLSPAWRWIRELIYSMHVASSYGLLKHSNQIKYRKAHIAGCAYFFLDYLTRN